MIKLTTSFNKKSIIKMVLILLVLVALPVTLILVRQNQDQRSDASYDTTAYIGTTDGFNVIHAYNYDSKTANGGDYNWQRRDNTLTRDGRDISYMTAAPNDETVVYEGNYSSGAEMVFNLDFKETGTYYFYARTGGADSGSDSFHYGIDGEYIGSHAGHWGTPDNGEDIDSYWAWTENNNDGTRSKIVITEPGFHTFHIWMRESGTRIHKFRLITYNDWSPNVNISDWGPIEEPARSTITVGTATPMPTAIPCVKQPPLIETIGDPNQNVVPNETITFTIRVTNRNSAECAPVSFDMNNVFNPNTTNINYSFSEDSFTLNSGESRDIIASYTPSQASNGQTFTATVTAAETGGQGSTTNLTINVAELTVVTFNRVVLHGIGIGGDNANPAGPGNQNPLTKTKILDIAFYDSAGNLVTEASGDITYSGTSKYFSGTIPVGSVLNGLYSVKVKTHKYLWVYLDSLITIVPGDENILPNSVLIAGDINSDSQTDLFDYDILIGCYSDLLPANDCDDTRKFNSDLTDDGKVNQDDYNLLLREWSNQPGA